MNYHPTDNMPGYGALVADVCLFFFFFFSFFVYLFFLLSFFIDILLTSKKMTGEAALRLMLADVQASVSGTYALIRYINYGIDLWSLLKGLSLPSSHFPHLCSPLRPPPSPLTSSILLLYLYIFLHFNWLHRIIDGGPAPSTNYQFCCSSQVTFLPALVLSYFIFLLVLLLVFVISFLISFLILFLSLGRSKQLH